MADLLTVDALVHQFGIGKEDLLDWSDPIPLDIAERAALWMAVYLCWLKRAGQRAGSGAPCLEKTAGDPGCESGDPHALLDPWFRLLDDAAIAARERCEDRSAAMESYAAHVFLAQDSAGPSVDTNALPDALDAILSQALRRAKDIALPGIDSSVHLLGRPMPLPWSVNPGRHERHLRRRDGNILFHRYPPVGHWDVINARDDDDFAFRKLMTTYREIQQQLQDIGDAATARDRQQLLERCDALGLSFLLHGTPEATQLQSELAVLSEPIVKGVRKEFATSVEQLRTFERWRTSAREEVRHHRHAGFVAAIGAGARDFARTLCSLEPDDIGYVLNAFDASGNGAGEAARIGCKLILEECVAEGYPRAAAEARLRVIERRGFVGGNTGGHRSPWMKRNPPLEPKPKPDPLTVTTMGDLLEQFDITEDDLAPWIERLPAELQERAPFWIGMYLCWMHEQELRRQFGNTFLAQVDAHRRRTSAAEAEGAAAWFALLDDAATNIGKGLDGPRPPREVCLAYALLVMDPHSPYYKQLNLPDPLEFTLGELLSEIGLAAFPAIETFVDNIEQTMPLKWSSTQGPAERRLRRRHHNLLFPRDQRMVAQAQIDRAHTQDNASLRELGDTFRALKRKHSAKPDRMPEAELKDLLVEYDELARALWMHDGPEAARWREQVAAVSATLVTAMARALAGHARALEKFNAWRKEAQASEARFRHAPFAELISTPPNDIVYTVCSFEPEAIASLTRMLDDMHYPDGGIQAAAAEVLKQAVDEGFPAEAAAARLRAFERRAP